MKATTKITEIAERFYITEPLLFVAFCSHQLVINNTIKTIRSGCRKIEYNEDFIERTSHKEVNEYLKLELIRLLLNHPYQRMKELKAMAYVSSQLCIGELYTFQIRIPKVEDIFPKNDPYFKRQSMDFYYSQFCKEGKHGDGLAPSNALETNSNNQESNGQNEMDFKSNNKQDDFQQKLDLIESNSDTLGDNSNDQESNGQNEIDFNSNNEPDDFQEKPAIIENNSNASETNSSDQESNGQNEMDFNLNNKSEDFQEKPPTIENNSSAVEDNSNSQEDQLKKGSGSNSGNTTEDFQMGEFALNKVMEQNAELWGEDIFFIEELNMKIMDCILYKSHGTISGNLIEVIKKQIEHKLDYKNILKSFRASLISSERVLTRMKPSRRYGFLNFGSKYSFSTHLLVAVDVSGSITKEEIELAFSIINRFFKYGIKTLEFFAFDTAIKGSKNNIKKPSKEFEVEGRGSTNFQCVFDYVISKPKFDGIIIITDGYAPLPDIYSIHPQKILWLFNNKNNYEKLSNNFKVVGKCAWVEEIIK